MDSVAKRNEFLSILSIILAGSLHYIIALFMPPKGSIGQSILLLTTAVTVSIALIFSIIHFAIWNNNNNSRTKDQFHTFAIIILLALSSFSIYI